MAGTLHCKKVISVAESWLVLRAMNAHRQDPTRYIYGSSKVESDEGRWIFQRSDEGEGEAATHLVVATPWQFWLQIAA